MGWQDINGLVFQSQKLKSWSCEKAFTWFISLGVWLIGFSINKMETLIEEQEMKKNYTTKNTMRELSAGWVNIGSN